MGVRMTTRRECTTAKHCKCSSIFKELAVAMEKKMMSKLKGHKPRNFSWVIDGLLAAQARPRKPGHQLYLQEHGVKYLVTLTLTKPLALQKYPGKHLTWIHIPIKDRTAPTFDQIKTYVAAIDKAKHEKVGLATHCASGRGRSGTMLACYLVKHDAIDANAAIEKIRALRCGSIEKAHQIKVIQDYANYLKTIG